MAASVIAAAAARAEREIIEHFRRERATSPERAVQPPPLRSPLGERRLRRLIDAQVLRPADGGYWLDESLYASHRSDRRAAVIALVVALLAVLVAVILAQRAY